MSRTAQLLPVLLVPGLLAGIAMPASATECLPQVDALIVEFELPASPEFTKILPPAPLPEEEPAPKSRKEPAADLLRPSPGTLPGPAGGGLSGRNAEPGFGRLGAHMQPDRSYDVSSFGETMVMPSTAPKLPEDKLIALKTALYGAREADSQGNDRRCRELLAEAQKIASQALPRD